MAVETQVLKDRGLSGPVISTMLRARKATSRKIYHRTWKAYISMCEELGCHPRTYVMSRILLFLQRGVDQALALGTVKSQVSALAVYFRWFLAAQSLVRTFIQGVRHVAPQCVLHCLRRT